MDFIKAFSYAKEKHNGQIRKFIKIPYVIHPLRVAIKVKNYTNNEFMIIAAMLHDVLEDTTTKYNDLKYIFGPTVADLVLELTIDKENVEKAGGKKKYLLAAVNDMSKNAFTIKLLDRLDNLNDLFDKRTTKSFIKWYTKETEYILNYLNREITDTQKEIIILIEKTLNELKEM